MSASTDPKQLEVCRENEARAARRAAEHERRAALHAEEAQAESWRRNLQVTTGALKAKSKGRLAGHNKAHSAIKSQVSGFVRPINVELVPHFDKDGKLESLSFSTATGISNEPTMMLKEPLPVHLWPAEALCFEVPGVDAGNEQQLRCTVDTDGCVYFYPARQANFTIAGIKGLLG